MKKFNTLTTMFLMVISINMHASFVQDSTGLLGDNFSLEGALDLFKNADSPEAFEKALNTENNYVNNLDLNEDGDIDYIKVIDNMDEDVHAIVLQIDINKNETQDIAVIEIEKTGKEEAMLQIIGDEELYGPEKIVEPYDVEGQSNGRGGPNCDLEFTRIIVNVWLWPSVRFIYRPVYSPWVSPWRWAYYPPYWRPWRPHPWRWHYNRRTHFHVSYRSVNVHRVTRAHKVYTPVRRTSTTVKVKSSKRTVVKTNTTTVKRTATGKKAVTSSSTTKAAVKKSDGTVKAGKKTNSTTVGKSATGNKSLTKKSSKKAAIKKSDGTVKAGKKTKTTKVKKGKKGKVKAGKKTTKTKVKKKKRG